MWKRRTLLMSALVGVTLIGIVAMMARSASATGALGVIGSIGAKGGPARSGGAFSQGQHASHTSATHTPAGRTSTSRNGAAATGQTTSGPAAIACAPWSLTTSASPSQPILESVAAVSATDVWAVGSYYSSTAGAVRTLVERYNGSTWSVVLSPSSGNIDNDLQRVMVISSNDIWAVGYWQDTNQPYQTLAEHWDGTKWSIIVTPAGVTPSIGYGYDVSGVSAVSSNDVWAVWAASQPIVEHWDGSKWSIVTVPEPGTSWNTVSDIVALSSTDVWIAGSYGDSGSYTTQALFEHWDGVKWTVVPGANAGWYSSNLLRIVANSGSDLWAVGYGFPTASSNMQTLTEHWNGSTWSLVSSPNPGGWPVSLNDVVAVSPYDVWAVGDMSQDAPIYRLPVVLHWDGRAWNVVSTPPTNTYSILRGVTAVAPENVFAVGQYILNPQPGVASKADARAAATQTDEYLVERYNPLIKIACQYQ